MNIYMHVFKISAPPTQLIFYKNKENFSCGPAGIPYDAGIIRWRHNVTIRHSSDYRYRDRDRIRFIGRMTRRLRSSTDWGRRQDRISSISDYKEDYLDIPFDLIRNSRRYGN